MSIDKLTRISELKEERDDLAQRVASIDEQIAKLIGEGFDIPGVARVRPMKKFGPKPKAVDGIDIGDSEVKEVPRALAVEVKERLTLASPPAKLDHIAMREKVKEVIDSDRARSWTTPDLVKATGLRASDISNALYWLGHSKKIARVARGLYRAA